MGVSINRGTPKMDGLNNGHPDKLDDLIYVRNCFFRTSSIIFFCEASPLEVSLVRSEMVRTRGGQGGSEFFFGLVSDSSRDR